MIDRAPAGTDPVSYRIDERCGVVFLTLRSDVTCDALLRMQWLILADPRYGPHMLVYVDCRILTSIPSHSEIEMLASERLFRAASTGNSKLAIVAMTRLGFAFALLLDSFLLASDDHIGLFTSHEDARAWLGLL